MLQRVPDNVAYTDLSHKCSSFILKALYMPDE